MLQSIDVIDDFGRERGLAGEWAWRGRCAFGDAAQRRRALETAARALEAVAVLRSAVLEQLRLVRLHGNQLRVWKRISCRRLSAVEPSQKGRCEVARTNGREATDGRTTTLGHED